MTRMQRFAMRLDWIEMGLWLRSQTYTWPIKWIFAALCLAWHLVCSPFYAISREQYIRKGKR